ncbi:hypothetical protein Goklo_000892, partial [Gossypium klotzschianum]|nr:hypothetical protein [Gossypium klotzschianum]
MQQVIKHGHLLLVHSVVIFFEDVDNEIPEENEEENMRNDVHILNDVAKLSSQIEKLCNATENMNQATSILTPVMDPYDIPQAIKVLNSMLEEVPEASLLYFFS